MHLQMLVFPYLYCVTFGLLGLRSIGNGYFINTSKAFSRQLLDKSVGWSKDINLLIYVWS